MIFNQKGWEIKLSSLILLGLSIISACINQKDLALPYSPSQTPVAMFTSIPTLTYTPKPEVFTEIPKPIETQYDLNTEFKSACQKEFSEYNALISPDGNWLAEDCYSVQGMQVSDKMGTKIYIVPIKKFYNDPLFPELSGSVRPVHWTKDSQYIYFTVYLEQWNDGSFSAFDSAPHLKLLKVANGEINDVLAGNFYYSFSPTDRRLIEIQQNEQPLKLIVHDLKTGDLVSLSPVGNPNYRQAGNVIWSPDGLRFVFVNAFGGEIGGEMIEQMIQSLILVNIENMTQEIIVDEISGSITPISWDENNIILYDVSTYSNGQQTTTSYKYDNNTKEAITLTP